MRCDGWPGCIHTKNRYLCILSQWRYRGWFFQQLNLNKQVQTTEIYCCFFSHLSSSIYSHDNLLILQITFTHHMNWSSRVHHEFCVFRCCYRMLEKWDLCWSAALPWTIAGYIWIEIKSACLWGWDRRKDTRSERKGWERTCACSLCQGHVDDNDFSVHKDAQSLILSHACSRDEMWPCCATLCVLYLWCTVHRKWRNIARETWLEEPMSILRRWFQGVRLNFSWNFRNCICRSSFHGVWIAIDAGVVHSSAGFAVFWKHTCLRICIHVDFHIGNSN